MKIKKAVIPCGGLGTRFLPITKAVCKEMLPIIDRPCLDYIVDELVASGIEEILIILSPDKDVIKSYYSPNPRLYERLVSGGKEGVAESLTRLEKKADIRYALQKTAKGSGDALLHAQSFCGGEAFALALGDDVIFSAVPVTRQLLEVYGQTQKSVLGVQRRAVPEILRYGVIDVESQLSEDTYSMRGIKEKPSEDDLPSDLCTLGRYILSPEIFETLHRTPVAKNGELQLTDGLNILAQNSGAVAHVFSGRRYDMGDKLGSVEAAVEYGLRDGTFGNQLKDYLFKLVKSFDA